MKCLICQCDGATLGYFIENDKLTHKPAQYYDCSSCGVKFVYPQRWQELQELYKKEFRKGISFKQNVIWRLPLSFRHKHTFKFLKHLPKGSMLDIGGGEGKFSWLMKLRGWDVLMLEPTEHYAEFARNVYKLKVIPCFIDELHTPQKFDLIVLSALLEHLPDQRVALQTIKSYLNKNGHLFVRIPHNESRWYAATHLFLHSEKSIRHVFEAVGLKINKLERREREFYVLGECA